MISPLESSETVSAITGRSSGISRLRGEILAIIIKKESGEFAYA